MSSVRSSAARLARVLSATSLPVYVVDQQREIAFVNDACAEWMGTTAEDLVGRQCDYHASTDDDGVARVVAALCPPPDALAGISAVATVSPPQLGSAPKHSIEFTPIGDTPASCVGVLAVARDEAQSGTSVDDFDWPQQLHAELAELCYAVGQKHALSRLAGNSPSRQRVRQQVELAASSAATVLIVGPRGSGRQHVARTIHETSSGDSRMIPLDCAVAPLGLVEHTLARAPEDRHTSNRDTLLLVDIDRLAVDAQTALARQLDSETLPFRVLATATEPLVDQAARGEFREDLAYELSVMSIELPRLRELSEDVPLLAQWFLEAENAGGKKQITGFTDAAMESLLAYQWPGNIDELAQVVHEAHHEAGEVRIAPLDLPPRLRLAADAEIQGPADDASIDLDSYLAEVELRLVRNALRAAEGNKSQAAKQLGMTRQRLYRRLVQLGLEQPE